MPPVSCRPTSRDAWFREAGPEVASEGNAATVLPEGV